MPISLSVWNSQLLVNIGVGEQLAISSGWVVLKLGVRPMREMKGVRMEAPPLERRLAAILAADVEGFSRLMHDDEEATLATLSASSGAPAFNGYSKPTSAVRDCLRPI